MTETGEGGGYGLSDELLNHRVGRLEHQLQLVVSSRVGEDQVAWTIFSIFWAAQALLVGVLFQTGQPPSDPIVGVIVSGIGIGICVVWATTQSRSLLHLERFEDLTSQIENVLEQLGAIQREHRLTTSPRFAGVRARDIMRVSCAMAVLAWIVSEVVFIRLTCK